jgi:HSP20 family protein
MLWTETFSPFTWQLGRTAFHPAADVTISDNDVVLTLDLPGLTADDVEIELADGYLAVRGERRRPELPDGSRNAHSERGYGRFERRIALPDAVDQDDRHRRRPARARAGRQLTVQLHRAPRAPPCRPAVVHTAGGLRA